MHADAHVSKELVARTEGHVAYGASSISAARGRGAVRRQARGNMMHRGSSCTRYRLAENRRGRWCESAEWDRLVIGATQQEVHDGQAAFELHRSLAFDLGR